MTATVKEICRINKIDESTEGLADMIFESLIGGDDGKFNEHCSAGKEKQTAIPYSSPAAADR